MSDAEYRPKGLKGKKKKIEFTYPRGDIPRLAICGNSNAGKSSLIKHLVTTQRNKQYKGKVGKHAGSTIKLNIIEDPKSPFQLIDLPGFGKMTTIDEESEKRVQEQILEYLETDKKNIFLTILVVNMFRLEDELEKYYFQRQDTIPLTIEFNQFINNLNIPILLVLNKIDKLNKFDLKRVKSKLNKVLQDFELESIPQINASMKNKIGISEIKSFIRESYKKSS